MPIFIYQLVQRHIKENYRVSSCGCCAMPATCNEPNVQTRGMDKMTTVDNPLHMHAGDIFCIVGRFKYPLHPHFCPVAAMVRQH